MPRPNGRNADIDPAAFLGTKLRQARVDAGFSNQDALAAKLGFERSVITKVETGERVPTDKLLIAWCAACGLKTVPIDWLVGLTKRAEWPGPAWFEMWLETERKARMLKYWQPIIIPALFQTADYARALLLAAQTDTSDAAIDALVEARLGRRAIFERPVPPDVVVVLDELILHRLVGSEQVMHEQLTDLAEMSTRPYISVQVVPRGNGANAGLSGTLNIAGGDCTDLVYTDAFVGHTTDQQMLVCQAIVDFDRIRGDALSRGQSRDLILRLADELWKP